MSWDDEVWGVVETRLRILVREEVARASPASYELLRREYKRIKAELEATKRDLERVQRYNVITNQTAAELQRRLNQK